MSDNVPAQNQPNQPSAWRPCVEGELTEFAQRARGRKRMDRMNLSATCGLVLLVAGIIAYTAGQHYSTLSASLDCGDVSANMAQYVNGNLPADVSARIDRHLAYCLSCNELYHQRTNIAHHARSDSSLRPAAQLPGRVYASGSAPLLLNSHQANENCHCPECWQFAARMGEKDEEE